jgi:hypothetical protein
MVTCSPIGTARLLNHGASTGWARFKRRTLGLMAVLDGGNDKSIECAELLSTCMTERST